MALATYSDLKTAVANHLARDDLTSAIDDFIDLAEARLSRELSPRSTHKRATAATSAGDEYVTLPTDLRSIRLVRLNTDPRVVLEFMTPGDLYSAYPNSGQAKPRAYTVMGSEIAVRPIPDTTYTIELVYAEGLAALSGSNTTNTVLTRYPDAYLYATLAAAYRYLMDEQRASYFDGLTTVAMDEINRSEEAARHPSGGLEMKATFYGEFTR